MSTDTGPGAAPSADKPQHYRLTFGIYNQTHWTDVRSLPWPELATILTNHEVGGRRLFGIQMALRHRIRPPTRRRYGRPCNYPWHARAPGVQRKTIQDVDGFAVAPSAFGPAVEHGLRGKPIVPVGACREV
jgi:hypothetical protein